MKCGPDTAAFPEIKRKGKTRKEKKKTLSTNH